MFEKTVTDLIRDIRSKKFTISQTLSEIQGEITKSDLRGNAIQKCCVLHLLGYDMNWIVFHVVESMSSHKPIEKRIGYLAASLLFNQDTPVLMLCTNLVKKDLTSNNVSDCAMALHTLAAIANRDLSRDLLQDVLLILNHSNPYIRKR
jgi:AP-3 complex subunit delta-1